MATAGVVPDPLPIVLRVKRKREEDPVEALMVTKHARIDPLQLLDSSGGSVFHFAGTLSSQAINEKLILDKVHQHKDHSKLTKQNPFSRLTLSESQDQRREQKKASSRSNRYKVVSEYRSLDHDKEVEGSESITSSPLPSCSEVPSELNLHIFDIEQEETKLNTDRSRDHHDSKASPSVSSSLSKASSGLQLPAMDSENVKSQSDITCNSTRLTRETVNSKSSSEFVYDLYYTQDLGQKISPMDWNAMTICDYSDVELVHNIIDSDDEYYNDDDDDSNDENNWRNDYPDEEDMLAADSNSDSEIDEEFRIRQAFLGDGYHFEHDDLYQ